MNNLTKIYGLLSLLFCVSFNPIAQGYNESKNNIKEGAEYTALAVQGIPLNEQAQVQYASIYNTDSKVYVHSSGLMLLGFLAFIGLGLFYYLFLLIIDVNKANAKFRAQAEKLNQLKGVSGSYGKFKMELS